MAKATRSVTLHVVFGQPEDLDINYLHMELQVLKYIKYYELKLQSVKKAHLLPFANIANHEAKRIKEIWESFSLPTIQIKLPALSRE